MYENEKELSSATHVAEASDGRQERDHFGGWRPPRLVARPAAAIESNRWLLRNNE